MFAQDYSWETSAGYRQAIDGNERFIAASEDFIRKQESIELYCDFCQSVRTMRVDVGPNFGEGYPNLREGLVCECGAKNRDRLMMLAIRPRIHSNDRIVVFGSTGRLAAWLRATHSNTTFCEHFGAAHASGARVETEDGPVLNENLCGMTFADGSVDMLVHCDVLEHIPNVARAAEECARVLAPRGRLIFTMPFFQALEATIVRARVDAAGTVEHLLPPEIHGDPIQPEGALAYYNFGWDVLQYFRSAGLANTAVHMVYDTIRGLVSNGCQYPELNMLPIYLVTTKT